ncbi:MAG TPA: sulfite exporter TauE/SafE family protein [Candidatus Thermoplasmatota archaeon]|nr:sulfite exporter TauE/SafE family protein [Candidatus Thermoplasmatota archaeon]
MTDASAPAVSTPRVLALGAVAGVMAGLFGVGGGTILVPGLVLLLALSQHRAHATSLAAIIVTAPAAAVGFALDGAVSVLAAACLAGGAVAGAYAGAAVMHRLSPDRLRRAFAVLMLIAAARLLVQVDMTPGDVTPELDAAVLAGLAALGLLAGVLSAVMGVGGGVVMVPVMVLLIGFGQHVAEGTSLLVIVPTALMGAWRHTRNGYTDWRLGLLLGLGGILGGLAGAQIALALSAQWLQRLFAVLLVYTGARLLRKD